MDKTKTGLLIKEARQKKGYTQSELGDLLGVTNKAISRWENGDSFPDIGVLESLASILDLKIQDIVTGNADSDYGNIASPPQYIKVQEKSLLDLIRTAKLQEKSKIRKGLTLFISAILLFLLLRIGLYVMNVRWFSDYNYYDIRDIHIAILFEITLICVLTRHNFHPADTISCNTAKPCHRKSVILPAVFSIFGILLCIFMTGLTLYLSGRYHSVFGIAPSKIGPFLSYILLAIFLLNFGLLIIKVVRLITREEDLYMDSYLAAIAIFVTLFFRELLGNLCTFDGTVQHLLLDTALVIIQSVGTFVIIFVIKKSKAK